MLRTHPQTYHARSVARPRPEKRAFKRICPNGSVSLAFLLLFSREKRRPVPRKGPSAYAAAPVQATPLAFQATSPLRRGGKARLEKREGPSRGRALPHMARRPGVGIRRFVKENGISKPERQATLLSFVQCWLRRRTTAGLLPGYTHSPETLCRVRPAGGWAGRSESAFRPARG